MARGRKQLGAEKKSEVISIRITEKQKELINKNPFLKEQIREKVLELLEHYQQK